MNRFLLALCALLLMAPLAQAADSSWIEASNRNAQLLLEIIARYNPESASSLGVDGHDAEVFDLKPRTSERQEADLDAAAAKLESLRATTADSNVKQDLDILIKAAHAQRQTLALNSKYLLPFFDLPQSVYGGFQNLLDSRVPKQRYPAAVTRLHRYVGAEKGFEPITVLARARYEERAGNPDLLGPWIVEAQQYLSNQDRYLDGIEDLLKKSGLKGWQKDMKTLRQQFAQYGEWVKSTVLPRARQTNRLPVELYADNLKNVGVEMDPQELMDRALSNYVQTRSELQTVAQVLAEQRKWSSSDYRDVIRMLKKERTPKDKLLDLYTNRLSQIEDIVRREHIVSLPTRKAVIRLATEAESAASAAPHLDPPRLIGNTGEPAEFVLPLSNPNAAAGVEMDDFNYDAIAWTLTAHEARPGHELQFAAMLERGISTARVVYAFNSANVEGWALYAEAVMKQYMPLEGQIGTLQMRMMREARAFLDPMLNLGLIDPESAKRVLMDEVVLSEPMAKQEIDRYTFNSPGQATAYFYGYSKLDALRTRVELALPGRFNELAYHDFIVGQGLLPFDLLEKAVMEEFVPSQRGGAAAGK
ncbi:MAG TPA: DUF885 domain-containing protein [Steroidobacteraceae bacterium]|jgi:uncharacterized protein (DUF885 family)